MTLFLAITIALGQTQKPPTIADLYTKREVMVPMRDGVRLYTSIYAPKDATKAHPILLERTPYGSWPYGDGKFPRGFSASPKWVEAGFIFVSQDVRGTNLSEGDFEDVRPAGKTDESTDAYDTVEWLTKNVKNNNKRVGLSGISYPGFYAAAAAINTHPAIKAVSPQAPVSDWWRGDDDHHYGVMMLQDCFEWNAGGFGWPRKGPGFDNDAGIELRIQDPYKFFLEFGPTRNGNDKFLKGKSPYWNNIVAHPDYDEWWQARDLGRRMKGVTCAVLTVGGWYDAEDLYGPFNIYRNTEKLNPKVENAIVMGPWSHGMWAGGAAKLGGVDFGSNTPQYFRDEIEFPFFARHLLDEKRDKPAEATMFDVGSKSWRKFPVWPPAGAKKFALNLGSGGDLTTTDAAAGERKYVSDPANPVPYTIPMTRRRGITYMNADQRAWADRQDILTYQTPELTGEWTFAGPVVADLLIKTDATDADFTVKLIDVEPEGGQRLVRWEVFRAKYRQSLSKPIAIKPGEPTRVRFSLNDICYTFRKGHRLMVRVQSSNFPLCELNPQTFTNIRTCGPEAFRKATIQVLSGPKASAIEFLKLP